MLFRLLQSSDKLVVEVFPEPEQVDQLVPDILQHLISPGQEVGGDSRLIVPSNKNVVTASEDVGGQVVKLVHIQFLACAYTTALASKDSGAVLLQALHTCTKKADAWTADCLVTQCQNSNA